MALPAPVEEGRPDTGGKRPLSSRCHSCPPEARHSWERAVAGNLAYPRGEPFSIHAAPAIRLSKNAKRFCWALEVPGRR